MVVRRFRPITLVTIKKVHGTLDDKEIPSFKTVMAHVTEINGAQLQNNLFGKQYNMTWVARIRGNVDAKYIFYPRLGVESKYVNKRNYYSVIQIRKHATRTDVYFANDTGVNSNELEQ